MKLTAQKKIFQIPQAEKYLSVFLPRLQEKRVQSFTTIALTIITLSFLGFFAISPTLSTIADLQKQITDSQFVNQQLQQKITNLTALQSSYKKLGSDVSIVYTDIPETPNVTDLVGQLQTLAANTNLTITNIQTLPVDISNTSTVQYNSFSFAMDVTGSYQDIKKFLQSMTNFNRIITFDAISLSKPVSDKDIYTMSLRGKAYFKAKQ